MRLAFALVLAIGCGGGGSGPPSDIDMSKKLVDLSPSELAELCTWEADVTGGPRTVDCGGGTSTTFKSKDQCVTSLGMTPTTCTVTVGQAESCTEVLSTQPCDFTAPECAPLLSCATSGVSPMP